MIVYLCYHSKFCLVSMVMPYIMMRDDESLWLIL